MITRTLVFCFPSEFELPGSTWDSVHQTLPANRSGRFILYRIGALFVSITFHVCTQTGLDQKAQFSFRVPLSFNCACPAGYISHKFYDCSFMIHCLCIDHPSLFLDVKSI